MPERVNRLHFYANLCAYPVSECLCLLIESHKFYLLCHRRYMQITKKNKTANTKSCYKKSIKIQIIYKNRTCKKFSILGMNLFGCKFCEKVGDEMNCDRKNFDSLLWALVTVFQVDYHYTLFILI